ncbi:MAG: MBL fold metallo-hydrolase [Parvibaculum sp.]|uniref:MBL fold metallo-hydrolase n=1 Tax=Parvibaculum sp. TaxID=2024848 RepID=UPI00284BC2B7|nr:MBL fold metallo-hydrolase [Parvibaculum sp.]MDR3497878.1 MBL fold metallo-hydrolase [Parvibaculum sp.]
MSDVSLAVHEEGALRYPLGRIPAPAEMMEAAPGIYWVRMPLPFQLNHINLWLIEEEKGWTLVDTGVATDEVKALWREIFATGLKGKPITRVIVTHLHPDHVGLAGWITRKFGVELHMSRTDFLMCRSLVLDTGREAPKEALDFYRAAGMGRRGLESYAKRFGGFGAHVSRLPDVFRRLKENDELQIGGRSWRVVVGSGHAPEHVCLYSAEAKILISGDQVLPRISSNVSVHPTEAHDNPLQDWIDSCHRIRANLPDDVLVLPAHNEPFYGLHARLTQLIDGHEEGLSKLHDLLAEPKRAIDVFPALFKREIGPEVFFMATGESLAHLNCLLGRKAATVTRNEKGVDWYVRA